MTFYLSGQSLNPASGFEPVPVLSHYSTVQWCCLSTVGGTWIKAGGLEGEGKMAAAERSLMCSNPAHLPGKRWHAPFSFVSCEQRTGADSLEPSQVKGVKDPEKDTLRPV